MDHFKSFGVCFRLSTNRSFSERNVTNIALPYNKLCYFFPRLQ